jgi:hypothetical protein
MHRDPGGRIQTLNRRVRWLDRYRRMLALAAAAVVAPILISRLADALGADWPQLHATVLSAMLGLLVWCTIEVGLVWVTAIWETECDRLSRDRGLPRAQLLQQRRRS